PGVVVAGHPRTLTRNGKRARGTIGKRGTSLVFAVRLLPFPRLVVFLAWRNVCAVVHPAVPAGRDLRSVSVALVDYPATRKAERRGAALIIDIAHFVFADALTVAPGEEPRSHGLAV